MKKLVGMRKTALRRLALIALIGLLFVCSGFNGGRKTSAATSCCLNCITAYDDCINNGGIPTDCCCFYDWCVSGCSESCIEVCSPCA
jgi:hypothetical protein